MELRKLSGSFYADNEKVLQALDFDMQLNAWRDVKVRGHGIVEISINKLTFAIPARSFIKHNASLILEVDRQRKNVKGMGLDYSKALLIKDRKHISDEIFLLKSKAAGKKLVGLEEHITKQFSKYVERYISAVKAQDVNILKSFEYKFTTLVNYHVELGL